MQPLWRAVAEVLFQHQVGGERWLIKLVPRLF